MRGRLTILLVVLLTSWGKVTAQGQSEVFRPHWYLLPQVGVNWVEGEASFSKQLSPAAALYGGYQMTPLWGVRAGISGWEAHNWQAHPKAKYKWNYIQPQVDVTISLSNLLSSWKPRRRLNAYVFLGVGMAFAFNNDEANKLHEEGGNFEKLWTGSKSMFAARGGVGADYRLSNRLSISVEAVANMLPEDFNSKIGKGKGIDWQIGLMAGVKIALGKTSRLIVVEEPQPIEQQPEATPIVTEPVVETLVVADTIQETPPPVEEKKESATPTEVFFCINQYRILQPQRQQLNPLIDYLKAHPETIVDIKGYADRNTGTRKINKSISWLRARAVSNYLLENGIPYERMTIQGIGDEIQPKQRNKDNRLVICIVNE